jgi:hypothetical protein
MHQKHPPANVAVSLTAEAISEAEGEGFSASEEEEERRSPPERMRTRRVPKTQEDCDNSFMVVEW